MNIIQAVFFFKYKSFILQAEVTETAAFSGETNSGKGRRSDTGNYGPSKCCPEILCNTWELSESGWPRSAVCKIKSYFDSIYLCRSLLSANNVMKQKNNSRSTDAHVDDCSWAGISSHSSRLEKLAAENKCVRSHWLTLHVSVDARQNHGLTLQRI